ncbi:hypothetical protein FRC07_001417 [Ceratobasidium sp. 392]|nr:hypothetical protein FRC07_001417 [Ceratobasidium sp. 392]
MSPDQFPKSKLYPPERYVGLCCLSVGAGAGGSVQMLARATVIDYWGNTLYDSFVKPTENVVNHQTINTRDAALYIPFREAMGQPNQVPGLTTLVWKLMERRIQSGYINSVENARASVDLFRSVQDNWETCIFNEEWPSLLPPAAYAQYFY